MKLLRNGQNVHVMSILGQQNVALTDYRVMDYCTIKEIDGKKLIYNNFTKLFADITDEFFLLKNERIKYSKELDELIKYWFLVPVDNNDRQLCDQVLNLFSLATKKSAKNNYIIFTTTDCNARCFYCFEHGVKRENMSEQTAMDVCRYIKENSKGEPVSIKWFGGEPLCNTKVIDIISKYLSENNIEFSSKMTSNGYLFDSNTVLRAKNNWNLKHVQITLDGTEKVYNRIKNYVYKDCPNPFNKVIGNISNLIENQIHVLIRLNVSDENRSDIYSLIDFIYNKFSSSEFLKIYASNLFDLDHKLDDKERERLIREIFKLNAHLADLGYLNYGLERWDNCKRSCMARNDSSVVITQTGQLGKCEHYSEGDKLYGSIYSSETDQAAVDYWDKCERIDECNRCILYPNCIGITNCPCTYGKCRELDRMIKINDLNNSIIATYKKINSVT